MAPRDRRHNREVLNLLLEKASIQGYLTTEDLLDVSPDVDEDVERMSVIMLALRNRGVNVSGSRFQHHLSGAARAFGDRDLGGAGNHRKFQR